MRVLVVTHRDIAHSPTRYDHGLIAGLRSRADVTIADWELMDAPSVSEAVRVAESTPDSFDACMVYVRFRFRVDGSPWDWSGFDGLRVWMEHDAWGNYSAAHPMWHGAFPAVYRRDRFDVMITTGRHTMDLLRNDGVNAQWMPKGYSGTDFHDLGAEREGVCTFGTLWASRRAMIARLRRRGVPLVDVSGPFSGLNDRLNGFSAAVVCNMPGRVPFGRPGRAVQRVVPSLVRVQPAVEPMIKSFEVAGAGCAPVLDHLDELDELGFVDGSTCLTYRTFDEAADKLLAADEAQLHQLGRAAAELARSRHTWGHRADLLVQLLSDAVAPRDT